MAYPIPILSGGKVYTDYSSSGGRPLAGQPGYAQWANDFTTQYRSNPMYTQGQTAAGINPASGQPMAQPTYGENDFFAGTSARAANPWFGATNQWAPESPYGQAIGALDAGQASYDAWAAANPQEYAAKQARQQAIQDAGGHRMYNMQNALARKQNYIGMGADIDPAYMARLQEQIAQGPKQYNSTPGNVGDQPNYTGGTPGWTGQPQPQVMPPATDQYSAQTQPAGTTAATGATNMYSGYQMPNMGMTQQSWNPTGNVTPSPNPQQGWLTGATQQGIGAAVGPFNSQAYDNMSSNLYQQANQNFFDNVKPGLDSNAIMAGGYGGDRAALGQGVVLDRMNQSVMNAMAPQYAQGYEQNLNRNLQAGQTALQGVLGLGNLDVSRYNADTSAMGTMGGLGLGAYNADTSRQLGLGNLNLGQYNADTSRQLGLGGLYNQQYGLDTQRQLGLGGLGVSQYSAESDAAYRAALAANPQYTNPLAAGVGGAAAFTQFLQMLNGLNPTTTPAPAVGPT
jgi:hypothetical protein